MARRCRPARSWSACSSRTLISSSRAVVRFSTTQAQLGHRQEWPDPRCRHRGRQSRRRRALSAHARSPHRSNRRAAAADRRRWRLCQPRQSHRRQGPRRCRCRLPQKVRHRRCRDGQKPVGVPPAAQLLCGIEAGSPASNVSMAPLAAPGAGSTTSKPISGPQWPTIWCCSPASNWHSRSQLRPAATIGQPA